MNAALTADLFTGDTVGAVAGGLLTLLVAGGVAWWAWRHAKRRVNRGQWRLERAGLRVRSVVLPRGPRREIVRMRLALHDNLAQTQRVFRQPAARGAVPASLRDLLPPLESLAAGLEGQLRLWQTEPDAGLISDALPELRDRGHALIAQALAVRMSALQLLHDADRLARRESEERLRNRVEDLNVTEPQITQTHTPPPTIVEAAPHR